MAYSLPCRDLNCVRVLGGGMSIIDLTLAGSTSIPFFDTMKPSSLPEVTPNTHFFGFSLTWNWSNL